MTKRPWTGLSARMEARTRLSAQGSCTLVTLALWIVCVAASQARAQTPQRTSDTSRSKEKAKIGVQVNKPGAFQGYTLVFPLQSTKTYLTDMQGRVVRTWESRYLAGQEAYLLENGNLLRPAKLADNEAIFAGAGAGGRVQEFTWDGKLVWDFKFHNEKQTQHHAVTRMPNGNVMLIVWERKTAKEFIEAGVKPELAGSGEMLVDALVEIKPSGKTAGEIAWEWHLWDHLVQDHDSTKVNYGAVAAHPELADANFARNTQPAFANLAQALNPPPGKDEPKKGDSKNAALDKLKGIGYVGAGGGRRFVGFMPDWTHVNAVAYNAKLDQIMLSPREFNEVWIIDHGTTTAEAASHAGGRYGRGGDLLYRWGNPQAYRAGTAADQRLFSQHDTHWIADGLPGEGHLLVFSNGGGRPDRNYSSVDEVVLPVGADGRYERKPGTAFGPDKPIWSYTAPNKPDFFAPFMSGAQRLPNGNTLICTGFSGSIFEVTPDKEIVWHYVNPAKNAPGATLGFGPPGGRGGFGGPRFAGSSRSVQLFPGFFQFALQLSADQRKKVDAFETEASRRLEDMLSGAQRKQLKESQSTTGPFGPGGVPEPGRVMSPSMQDRLKLTDAQKKQLDGLQKEAIAKVDEILKDEQKKQLKEIEDRMKTFAVAAQGIGRGGPAGRGGRPGGFGGFGGMSGSAIFRAYRYAPDYPGLAGNDLTPGKTIEELEAKPPEKKN